MRNLTHPKLNRLVLLTARVLLSIPFVTGGVKKLFAYGAFATYLASKGLPFPTVLAAPAVATELIGGLLLVFGVQLKIVAPYLAAYTLFTAFTAHHFWTFDDPKMRFEMTVQFWKNVSIVGGFLALYVASHGKDKPTGSA